MPRMIASVIKELHNLFSGNRNEKLYE